MVARRFLGYAALLALAFSPACGEGVLPDAAAPADAVALADARSAGDAASAVVCLPDPESSALGTWYLNAAGARWTVAIAPGADCQLAGTLVDEAGDGTPEPLERLTWSAETATLGFRRPTQPAAIWLRAQVVAGVLRGRVATTVDAPTDGDFTAHVTGWNATALDTDIVPRTFELTIAGGQHAVLRVDRGPNAHTPLQGRIKVYATDAAGAAGEGDSYDLQVQAWDGQHLVAQAFHAPQTWTYTADVAGRALTGQLDLGDGNPPQALAGTRADVLGFGLQERQVAARDAWQQATRRRLAHLAMAGNPQPLRTRTVANPVAAILDPVTNPGRDDNSDAWPQAYTLTDVQFTFTLADSRQREPLERTAHAVVSRPLAPPPPGGYPIAIALNGHYGSAMDAFDPNNTYWYGDAFARRGYVVVALDVGHRPLADRAGLYGDLTDGDDPSHGNLPHPAVAALGFDSDWEEDGERTWDAMRAVDYAVQLPDVNPQQIVAVGLSMGGEVVTQLAALDPRVAAAVVAGYSPDMGVMLHHANHACWQWQHADIREFVDVSDHLALVAPRGLIVETGAIDTTFSARATPFSADKQVLRRARTAFLKAPQRVVHYLHAGAHAWHAGDVAGPVAATDILVPVEIAPTRRWSLLWQEDARTRADTATVFDRVHDLLTAP